MKYKLGLLAIICVLLLTGCGAKYKDECLKKAKELYAAAGDETITSCVIEYADERKDILHTYCINKDKVLYVSEYSKIEPDDQYYDTYYKTYENIKAEVTTPVDGYYTYEFQADELK